GTIGPRWAGPETMEEVVMFTTEGLIFSASSAKLSGATKARTGAAGIASARPAASARAEATEATRLRGRIWGERTAGTGRTPLSSRAARRGQGPAGALGMTEQSGK